MGATHPNKAISIVMEQKNNHIIYPKVEPFVEILSWKSRIFIVTEKSCQHIYLKMYMISHNLLDCYLIINNALNYEEAMIENKHYLSSHSRDERYTSK